MASLDAATMCVRDMAMYSGSKQQLDLSDTDSFRSGKQDDYMDRQTDRQTDRQAGRQTDTKTDRQTDRQTDRHKDRQTDSSEFKTFWRRCLSVALQRCNASVMTRKLARLAKSKDPTLDSYLLQPFVN